MAFQQIGDSPLPPAGSPQNRDLALESDVVGMVGSSTIPTCQACFIVPSLESCSVEMVYTVMLVMLAMVLVLSQVTRV